MSLTHMSMHPPRTRQRGMSMTMIMVSIAVTAFIGMFVVKVGSHYVENMTVTSIAETAAANTELLRKPPSQVYSALNQAYRTNNLWDIKAEDTIALKKDSKRGYTLTVQYEKRATLFANIDIVTVFDTPMEDPS